MPITHRNEYVCECNKCYKQDIYDQLELGPNPTYKKFKKAAEKDGWLMLSGEVCYCEKCRDRVL